MNYNNALDYIFQDKFMGPRERTLSRMEALMGLLSNPQKKFRFVHVAGTNGKGSTSAMLAHILGEAGLRTGLFTSPSLVRYNERIKVGMQDIPDHLFAQCMERVAQKSEILQREKNMVPSFFELVTACAFLYFEMQKCDIVVLEVGLGGEFDATNVIDAPEVSVISSISFDHTKILGADIKSIAQAKAQIIKSPAPVVFIDDGGEVGGVIKAKASQQQVEMLCPEPKLVRLGKFGISGQVFSYKGFENLKIHLIGLHQINNALLAITVALALRDLGYKISDQNIYAGLENTVWPGRMEVLSQNPLIILDGAHNPHGAKMLAESLETYFVGKKIHFIVGILEDKGYQEMLEHILPLAESFLTVAPKNIRSIPAKKLAEQIKLMDKNILVEFCGDVEEALSRAKNKAGETGIICIFGSLYFVGDVIMLLEKTGHADENSEGK